MFYDVGPARPTGDVFLLTFQRALELTTPRPRVRLLVYFIPLNPPPDALVGQILSISYGSDEAYFSTSQANTMCNAAQQLSAMGVTIVVSGTDYISLVNSHIYTRPFSGIASILFGVDTPGVVR